MNLLTVNRSGFWKSLTVAHWKKLLVLCMVLCWLELGFPRRAYAPPAPTLTSFDPPGSVGTWPTSINPSGTITGYYIDASIEHGFLRAPDGSFTTFDAPGSFYTQPQSINPAGVVTGSYIDASNMSHGFLRALDGSFTTFDAPGSVETWPASMKWVRGRPEASPSPLSQRG